MKVHFIAIGGAAMHNLALALHLKGFEVSGSDDAIFDPSKSRLKSRGLLPEAFGWFPEKITLDLDAIILGMHARIDNPELIRAQDLGLKIYSYPEFIYEQSKDKTRIVIAGSHGKTTITAMILHVLDYHGRTCDYMVGAQLDGFDVMVQLSDNNDFIVLEGDEYLSSPLDLRPKFHNYKPNIALVSGIAWDHINVFPTFENYKAQFSIFVDSIVNGGSNYKVGTGLTVTVAGGTATNLASFTIDSVTQENDGVIQFIGIGTINDRKTSGFNGVYRFGNDSTSPNVIRILNGNPSPGVHTTSNGIAVLGSKMLSTNTIVGTAATTLVGIVTVTTPAPHGLAVGNKIRIELVTSDAASKTAFNKDHIVQGVTANNKFTIRVNPGITPTLGLRSSIFKYAIGAQGQDTSLQTEKVAGSLLNFQDRYLSTLLLYKIAWLRSIRS